MSSLNHLDLVHSPPHLLARFTRQPAMCWLERTKRNIQVYTTKEGTKFPQMGT